MNRQTPQPVSRSDRPAGPAGEGPTDPSTRSDGRRGVAFWVGFVLVVGGLGILGYVGWQLYGTTIVSKQVQQRIVEDLESQWSVAPGPRIGKARSRAEVPVGTASAVIRIPAFGDDYAVPVIEGIGDAELARGYGHFPETADPGERGNYALAAHRITHGEPLRDMPKLRPGDEIVVETRDTVYTYVLDTNPNDLSVTFEETWVIDPLPRNPDGGVQPAQKPGQRLITLTTCAELFATDYRMIAFGHLASARAK